MKFLHVPLLLMLFVCCKVYAYSSNDVHYYFYDRKYRKEPISFDFKSFPEIRGTYKTVFYIVHGWMSSTSTLSFQDLKTAILDRFDATVIMVNWSYVASYAYHTTFKGLPHIGKELSKMFDVQNKKYPDYYQWCVGHSLGSHVCGFAGKAFYIDQVTAIDAPGVGFEMDYGLSKKSAKFVQVIHTTASLGAFSSRGHADFYPNGGQYQPNCWFWNLVCNHSKGVEYFKQSFYRNWKFVSKRCNKNLEYCRPCDNCKMGFPADPKTRGTFYTDPKIVFYY